MPRPCTCDRPDCPLCHKYHTDERYRKLWDAPARAARFVKAAVQHVLTGAAATPEEKARRLALCVICPEYDAGSCRLCGCRLDWKAGWAEQHCPKMLW